MARKSKGSRRRILVIDVGGTHIKFEVSGQRERREFNSGPQMTAKRMVSEVKRLTKDWDYDVLSIGYPGLVVRDRVVAEPHNLGPGWAGFDFQKAFKRPVKLLNDAAMQALGSYDGGRMLFLGIGTGLGSAMIVDGVIEPMELAHLPYRKGKTFEDYAGVRGIRRLGKRKWRKHVLDIINRLTAALQPEYVVLGGGNADKIGKLPRGVRLGGNDNAIKGGYKLWDKDRTGARS
ncbi:polyphosphate glucokinase [Rhodoplanes sp. Z2-YC6860]|nr:ROK family protein [Rhodoplanes sp. Z2-YC6860]AMN41016.1 polyphosphate glucokinase [Rhodoplanes sp. Z2-YC6860]